MTRSERQLGILWSTVALGVVLLSPFAGALARRTPACPFKSLTGVPCPSCGSGRAALALADWRFLEALQYPLATLGWTLLIVGGLVAGLLVLLGRPLPRLPRQLDLRWRLAIVAMVLLNWVYLIWSGV